MRSTPRASTLYARSARVLAPVARSLGLMRDARSIAGSTTHAAALAINKYIDDLLGRSLAISPDATYIALANTSWVCLSNAKRRLTLGRCFIRSRCDWQFLNFDRSRYLRSKRVARRKVQKKYASGAV